MYRICTIKMSLYQSTVTLFYVILGVLSLCTFTFAAPTEISEVHSTDIAKVNSYPYFLMSALLGIRETMDVFGGGQKTHRVKRGSSKFEDASKMSQMKLLQLMVAMFSNALTDDPVGAPHPLSRRVPYAFVKLMKEKLASLFAPEIQETHEED